MEAKTDSLNRFHLLSHPSEEIVQCPSCEAKIKRYEVAEHYEQEMERLKKMQLKAIRELEQNEIDELEGNNDERRKPYTVFQKVQKNRQSRLRQRSRRRPASPLERACPICNKSFPQDEIEAHAEDCLRKTNGATNGNGELSSDDGDGGEEYEEYEWAGQKRIRVSSLLQGGYASIGVGQAITNRSNIDNDDEDEDLNVDEDDSHIYGPPQYGEHDVIAPGSEENAGEAFQNEDTNVSNYVRKLIADNANDPTTSSSVVKTENNGSVATFGEGPTLHLSASSTTSEQIIESLKAKLRHYENQVQSKFKCLICLDDYKNPAISVACWHVHCEQCWLRSLGARKLCPQCNLITTPKDLRRIYM